MTADLKAEIARLTATVDRYAEALRPFAEIGTSPDRTFDYYTPAARFMPTIPHSWVAAARAALASQPAPVAPDTPAPPTVADPPRSLYAKLSEAALSEEAVQAIGAWRGLSDEARDSVFVTYKLGAEHADYNRAALAALALLRRLAPPPVASKETT